MVLHIAILVVRLVQWNLLKMVFDQSQNWVKSRLGKMICNSITSFPHLEYSEGIPVYINTHILSWVDIEVDQIANLMYYHETTIKEFCYQLAYQVVLFVHELSVTSFWISLWYMYIVIPRIENIVYVNVHMHIILS